MDNPAPPRHIRCMSEACDILIVGGGLNGPALALALSGAGFSVTVIDALPEETRAGAGFDGRGYALARASQRLLSALGVWPAVEQHAQPILDIKVSDGHAGAGTSPLYLHFDHAELEEGPMGFILEDRYLRPALLAAMSEAPNITRISGQTVVAQEVQEGSALVTLGWGDRLAGRLILGCDGRASGTAQRAGIKRTGWAYGQTALVCAIAHEKDHQGTAHQLFLPSGPLAILPLPGGHQSSIVWAETEQAARAIHALDDAEYLEVLRPRFGDFLGSISLAGKRFTYPLSLTVANEYVAPRVALVGDAAHGVHPIAGQGLNLGLRDVAALAEVLTDARRRGEDFAASDVLARYQEWRRFDSTALALAMDGVNRLFSNDNPLLRGVRDLGLGAVNALPGLRRRFMREAAGLRGDLPRLLAGRPL